MLRGWKTRLRPDNRRSFAAENAPFCSDYVLTPSFPTYARPARAGTLTAWGTHLSLSETEQTDLPHHPADEYEESEDERTDD